MVKKRCWKKEIRGESIIFRNTKKPDYTYEIHKLEAEEEGDIDEWYHFPAIRGKGIPNSPDISETKKEAIDEAKKYMKKHCKR